MKRLAVLLALWLPVSSALAAQSVTQSGNVSPNHVPVWATNGVVKDGGTASNPIANSFGVVGGQICINSGPITGAYNALCFAATATGGGTVSIYNYAGATGGLSFVVNGVVQGFPTIPVPTTTNDAVCFANTAGQLTDCSPSGIWKGTKIGLAYGGTNADLSATGGTHDFLKQASTGAAITVGQPAFSDLSGIITLAQGGLGADMSAAAANSVPVFPGSAGAAVTTTLSSIFASPPALGGTSAAAGKFTTLQATGNLTTNVTGSTQCLHVNSSGVVSGASSDCAPSILTSANFGGVPWVDVKSGANGCAAAVGNATNDDTSAIQCQATYMYSTYGGGIVFVPPGNYKVTSTITVPAGVMLQGAGVSVSYINGTGSDFTVFHYTGNYGGMQQMFVNGYQGTGATLPTILIDAGTIQQVFRDNNIWGGLWGVKTSSVDSLFENNFIIGFGTAGGDLYSNGGVNWYIRDKFDDAGGAHTYGVKIDQGALVGIMENHFTQCDFSGNYTYSLYIDDGTNTTAVTVVDSGVLGAGTTLAHQKWTSFIGMEVGVNITISAGSASVTGSYGLSAVTATSASCAGNISITC